MLVRAGSAQHQKPLVPSGHERSAAATQTRRSQAIGTPTSHGEAAWDRVRAPPRHPWFASPTWYRSAGCSKLAGLGGRKKPPVIWIIVLLLILGASAAVSLRIEALTWRDKPAEPSLAQRWKAMGGG
jgi:hypothetical protein